MRIFIGLFLLFILFHQIGNAQSLPTVTSAADIKYLKKTLRKNKFSAPFINSILRTYEKDSFGTIIKYNMLGFLNPPQHSVLVTDEGVARSDEFITRYQPIFNRVEKRDHVPASVIAALLWVETKHGKLTGRYHETSVFAHLIQVTRKDVVYELTDLAIATEKEKEQPRKNLRRLMGLRTKRKAAWAFDELRALEKFYKKDKKMVSELQGSFAGAFGIPQFIPSSYFTYARPLKKGTVADLYLPDDAISSVSNYLKKTGWNSKKRSRQMKALMHYNNSEDYAQSILQLSDQIVAAKSKASAKN